MNKPSLHDIPKFPYWHFSCDVSWRHLEDWIEKETATARLELVPDFQRGHVWTDAQASRFIEFKLRGGRSGGDLLLNCPGFTTRGNMNGPYVMVDGLQRVTAVRRFLRDEIPAFGRLLSEYRDRPDRTIYSFHWCVAELETRAEVLRWYLDLNAGGTPHAATEIERVRALLAAAEGSEAPHVDAG